MLRALSVASRARRISRTISASAKSRMVGDVLQHGFAGDDGADGRLDRLHAGGARAAVERHLADVFARPVQAQRDSRGRARRRERPAASSDSTM